MARRLPPWHWLRVLRAEGPPDPNVHLLLYVLSTFMNRDGECWPAQSAIVNATRLCRATVQRCIESARRGEWIAVQPGEKVGQGWRLSNYCATVPDRIDLGAVNVGRDVDLERMADTWQAQLGTADDPLHGKPGATKGGPTVRPRSTKGGLNDRVKVAQPLTKGGLNRGQKVAQPLGRKSSSKSSRKSSEEGHALTRTTDRVKNAKGREPEPGAQPKPTPGNPDGSDLATVISEVWQGPKPREPKPKPDLGPSIRRLLESGESPESVQKILSGRGCTLDDVREAMS